MGNGVRFAPSPTGDFHVGNLRTAWISHWWARALGLPWVVRCEDIDGPRVVKGSRERQLADMAKLGLVPDREYLQSERRTRHLELFRAARVSGAIYPCYCSRKDVQDALASLASAPHAEAALYDGRCRERAPGIPADFKNRSIAWRFREREPAGVRDFIVARTDHEGGEAGFVPAYPWACAIDDWDGNYDLLVRASDLAHALAHQRSVQQWARALEKSARPLPAVFHTSLVTGVGGGRLEKRTRGVTLAELKSSGFSADAILERFAESFAEIPGACAPERVWGEAKAAISLADLGLSPIAGPPGDR